MTRETRNAFIAAGLIIAAIVAGMLAMPMIMTYAAGLGPAGGVVLAFLFIVAFFAILWARGRYQSRNRDGSGDRP